MEPIALSSNESSAKPVHLYQIAMIQIVTREYDDTCTDRDPLSPHTVFVFRYEVERLVDVCVSKLTCITDMYIIANGYRMRIRCY